MHWYLLLTNNVDHIDTQSDNIIKKCSRYLDGIEFAVYMPLPFVDHTGYTETVRDEIDFVIGSQKLNKGAYLNTEVFIREWDLSHLLNQRVVHLSGGWRKFLGVALFTNQQAQAKLYFDVVSHLADERLKTLMRQLAKQQYDQVVVFCEYDIHLIYNLVQNHFSLLFDAGDRVEAVEKVPQYVATRQQSNYERP